MVLFVNFDAPFYMMLDNMYETFVRIIPYFEVCQEFYSVEETNWEKSGNEGGSIIIHDNIRNLLILYESNRRIANEVRFGMQRELGGFVTSPIQHDDFLGRCDIDADTFNDFQSNDNKFPIKSNISIEKDSKFPMLRTIDLAITFSLADQHGNESSSTMNSTSNNAPFSNTVFNRFSYVFCFGVFVSSIVFWWFQY